MGLVYTPSNACMHARAVFAGPGVAFARLPLETRVRAQWSPRATILDPSTSHLLTLPRACCFGSTALLQLALRSPSRVEFPC